MNSVNSNIFKNKNYIKVFSASFLSQMGTVIGVIALAFYLLDHFSNQPQYATIAELMYSFPTLVLFFIVGVVADRIDRQKIAFYCNGINFVLSLFLLVAVSLNFIPIIFALLALRSGVSKFFGPAETGLIQGILNEDQYTQAAGLNQMIMSLFIIFGNALGALVYWNLGIKGAISLDAVSFFIAGILIRSCLFDFHTRLPNGEIDIKKMPIREIVSDFKKGFLYILDNKLLLAIIRGAIMVGLVNGGFALMPIFLLKYKLASETYQSKAIFMGLIFGCGILLGTLLIMYVSKKIQIYKIIILGFFLTGVLTITAGFASSVTMFFIIWFFIASIFGMVNVAFFGWIPKLVDPKLMGRIQALIDPILALSHSLMLTLVAFFFPKYIKVEIPFYFLGGGLVLFGIFYLLTLPMLASKQEFIFSDEKNK